MSAIFKAKPIMGTVYQSAFETGTAHVVKPGKSYRRSLIEATDKQVKNELLNESIYIHSG